MRPYSIRARLAPALRHRRYCVVHLPTGLQFYSFARSQTNALLAISRRHSLRVRHLRTFLGT